MAILLKAVASLDGFSRLVLPYHELKLATDRTDPCDPPWMGAKSTITSNHPSTQDIEKGLLKQHNARFIYCYYIYYYYFSNITVTEIYKTSLFSVDQHFSY